MADIFEQLDVLQERIQDEILLNQNLLKLIYYPVENPLNQPDVDDVQSLVDKYIYFKPIAFESVIQEGKTILLLSFGISNTRNRTDFIDINFVIRVISHNTLYDVEIDNVIRTRVHAICSELNKSFLNARGSWLGKCEFKHWGGMTTAQDYYGVGLTYEVTNFKA
ncbi:hypothetical protein [uncultured Clostridium sp.]|uniref:hypothetical protein n=1 Tax=uncultured Clostridium sp. TaxID=59620 RepID=UPI0032164EB2